MCELFNSPPARLPILAKELGPMQPHSSVLSRELTSSPFAAYHQPAKCELWTAGSVRQPLLVCVVCPGSCLPILSTSITQLLRPFLMYVRLMLQTGTSFRACAAATDLSLWSSLPLFRAAVYLAVFLLCILLGFETDTREALLGNACRI